MLQFIKYSFLSLLLVSLGFKNIAFSQTTYYWVGGTGSWSDITHWSLTSGGAGNAGIPIAGDITYFDASSGTGTVSNATIDTIAAFIATNSSILSFNTSLCVTDSFIGPMAVSTFGSAGKLLNIKHSNLLDFKFMPNNLSFVAKIRLNSSSLLGAIKFDSDLNSSDSLIVINGNINFNAKSITCGSFTSNIPTLDSRSIDFSNTTFLVVKNQWVIHHLTSLSRPKLVKFNGAMNGDFLDQVGLLSKYDSLVLTNASQIKIDSSTAISKLYLDIDTLLLNSSILLKFDTLYNPTASCSALTNIKTIAAPNGQIEYTGINDTISFHFCFFNHISAMNTPIKKYIGQNIYQTSSNNIQASGIPNTFYWIGDGGNWSDGSHWSESSGGNASCYFPKYNDTIIFDQNSFTLPSQTVHLDTAFVVGKMTWQNIPVALDTTTFLLEDSLDLTGNLTLDPQVYVYGKYDPATISHPIIQIKKSSLVNLNGSIFNATVRITTPQSDTVQLMYDYISTDTTAIFFESGNLKTNNFKLHTQSILYYGATQIKSWKLGNSQIELVDGLKWDTTSTAPPLTVVPGNSTITVGKSSSSNYFIAESLQFHNVVFNFNPSDTSIVTGNNTMKSLTINAGSTISFKSGKTFTTDTLIINGGCDNFLIDTTYSIKYKQDTLTNTISYDTTIFDSSTTNSSDILYGFFKLVPELDLNDTTFIFGHKSTPTNADTTFLVDTLITYHHIANIPVYDTTGVSPNFTYYYRDTIIRATRTVSYMLDSIGLIPLVSYGVDSSDNGKQFVNLFASSPGSPFTFSSTKKQKIYGVGLQDIHLTGNTGDVYFGADSSNNTGWTFNTSPSTTASFITDNAYCFGDTVHFTNTSTAFSGNTNDLTYVWNYDESQFLGDTNVHKFIHSGRHIVSLTTYYTNSCSSKAIDTIFINQPTINLNMSEADTSICLGTSIEFTASSNDSSSLFQFYKNGINLGAFSLVDSIIINNLVDNDTISVVSQLGACYSNDSTRYVFDVHGLPSISLSSSDANDSICIGTNVAFIAGGATTYQYFKNNNPITINSTNVNYSTSNLATNDTIYVIGTESTYGCKDTSSLHIFRVDTLPVISLTTLSPTTICENTSVTFNASGAQTYLFFVNSDTIGVESTSSSYVTDTLHGGDIITVSGTNTAGCRNNSADAIAMTVNSIPTMQLTSDDADSSICAGTPVNFYAAGAGTYEFFLNNVSLGAPSGTNSIAIDTLDNNDYITVEGSFSGCSGVSDTIRFEVNANPITDLTSSDIDSSICQNTYVTFTGTGATNYEFFINGLSVSPNSPVSTYSSSSLTNGSIIKLVGESNGCYISDQMSFTVKGIPNVNAISSDADNILCLGESLTITGSGADSVYQISIDGSLSPNQVSGIFNPSLTVGSHIVYLEGVSTNGCSNTSSNTFTININPIPNVTLASNDTTICTGQNVLFTAAGSNLYQFFIDGNSQTSNTPVSTFNTSSLTNGQVVIVKGSSLGCIGTSSAITFVVNPIPTMIVSSSDADNIFCQSSLVTYTATGPTDYEFLVDGTSQGAPSSLNIFDANTLSNGNHTLTITGTTSGCSTSQVKNITVNSNPVISFTSSDLDNIICAGDTIILTGTGASTYEFFLNGTSITGNIINPEYTTHTTTAGDSYNVVGMSTAGCTDTSALISITVNPNPTVTLLSSDIDNTICAGDTVTFTANGASLFEFFVNGVSQGAPSASNTLVTSSLPNSGSMTVVGTSIGCSMTPSSIVTTVNQIPIVSLISTSATSLCSNQNAQLTAGGANMYEFFINGISQGVPNVNPNFNAPVSNNDMITVIGQTNGCSDTSNTTITFSVTSNPVISTLCSDLDLTICKDDIIQFTSSGASTYNFELNGIPVQTGVNNIYSNGILNNNDVVTVTGYNANCPSSIDAFTFIVNSMDLDFVSAPSEIVCEGSSVQLNASGGDLYQFFIDGASQGAASATSTITVNNAQLGDYVTFIATNSSTGCNQALGYDYYPTVIPTVQIIPTSSTSFCEGDSVILTSQFPYGNQWYLNGTAISGATDTSYIATSTGTYSLEHISGGSESVWSKGYNGSGTIGNTSNIDSSSPLEASGISDIKQIAAGYDFAIALDNSGNVYSWGVNGSGQLGNGTFTTSNSPAQIATLSGIKQIAATSSSCAALTNSGTLYVWGNNNYGQLGIGSFATINFPFQITTVSGVEQIVGGQDHFVILKNNNTVWTVGKNTFGQLGQGNLTNSTTFIQIPTLSGIDTIGSGENHSFAVKPNGDLFVWGNNINGQLGLGDNTNKLTPVLSNVKNVVYAEGGATHSIVLTKNKEIYTMGDNTFGQLGDNSLTQTNYPHFFTTIAGVKSISTGEYSSLLLLEDNRVLGSGYNAENQLQPTMGNVMSYTQINQVEGATAVEAGKRTTHYLFGNSGSCSSGGIGVTEFIPTHPTITETGNVLTTISAVAYQWYFNNQLIPSGTQQSYTAIASGNYFVSVTDANGCTVNSDTIYHGMLGLSEAEKSSILIYPNPTNGVFHIDFTNTVSDISIEILDLSGRLVYNKTINQTISEIIDLSTEAEGMYIIKLKYKEITLKIDRIVVQK